MLGTVLTWRPEADWSRAFKVDYEDARRGAFWLALTLKTDSIAFAGTIHRGNDQLTPAFWFADTAYWNHCSEKAVSHGNTLKFEHNSTNPLEQNSGATFCIFAESFRNFLCNPLRLNCQELSSMLRSSLSSPAPTPTAIQNGSWTGMVTTSNASALTFCSVEGGPSQVQARTNTDAQPLNPATSNATTKAPIHESFISVGICVFLQRPDPLQI